MNERWVSIDSVAGYSVSDHGRVRSDATHKVLKPWPNTKGYLTVTLRGCRYKVHQLVARAFLGYPPAGTHTRHCDDDKSNNRLTNLLYGTPLDNAADAKRNGRLNPPRGERHGSARLSAAHVVAIRSDTRPQRVIAEQYGVSQVQIGRIKRGVCWAGKPVQVDAPEVVSA